MSYPDPTRSPFAQVELDAEQALTVRLALGSALVWLRRLDVAQGDADRLAYCMALLVEAEQLVG